ncbi:MAG TPA: hypothetical protein VMM15_32210, partial [Bradyrhizobium sp.]|nr:hypothetical protein [Bradyrhizobium sp.]
MDEQGRIPAQIDIGAIHQHGIRVDREESREELPIDARKKRRELAASRSWRDDALNAETALQAHLHLVDVVAHHRQRCLGPLPSRVSKMIPVRSGPSRSNQNTGRSSTVMPCFLHSEAASASSVNVFRCEEGAHEGRPYVMPNSWGYAPCRPRRGAPRGRPPRNTIDSHRDLQAPNLLNLTSVVRLAAAHRHQGFEERKPLTASKRENGLGLKAMEILPKMARETGLEPATSGVTGRTKTETDQQSFQLFGASIKTGIGTELEF